MANVKVFNRELKDLIIPQDYQLQAVEHHERQHETITVYRYDQEGTHFPNNPHVTVVYGQDGRLISYDSRVLVSGSRPNDEEAKQIAYAIFEEVDSTYAKSLSFMRIDHQNRAFKDVNGKDQTISIAWVKFASTNGSYNWVSVGPGGRVIELERESYWNYFTNRRATEQWNLDDWVLARSGKGPQLSRPNAVA